MSIFLDAPDKEPEADDKKIIDIDQLEIPGVRWEVIDVLYKKFAFRIKDGVELKQSSKKANRDLIHKVSDVIWSNLTRNYKDKAHQQTLYSYMVSDKLDRFGVAYSVVAACQILGLDVRLVLSEDHAWVTLGAEASDQSAEVTWHGKCKSCLLNAQLMLSSFLAKGNKDKRGQSVVSANCWLYLDGYAVVCSPHMAVAALVASINPTINQTAKSEQMVFLQKKLFQLLYDKGHLEKYPMAMCNLAELEELHPTPDAKKAPIELFEEAIISNKKYYANHHVHPYTSLASYYYRNGRYREALQNWSYGASVLRQYNYTHDDKEIYTEFLEIANDLIPHMLDLITPGGCEPGKGSKIPLLQDPQCFASLLVLYDGLCGWEEESSTPVLHIGWAKAFIANISKFTAHTRAKVQIEICSSVDMESSLSSLNGRARKEEENKAKESPQSLINTSTSRKESFDATDENFIKRESELIRDDNQAKNDDSCKKEDSSVPQDDAMVEGEKTKLPSPSESNSIPVKGENAPDLSEDHESLPLSPNCHNGKSEPALTTVKDEGTGTRSDDDESVHESKVSVVLTSQKMIGLKDLLLSEKLNTSAIQLQLTAQSQVYISKRPRGGSFTSNKHQSEFDFLTKTTSIAAPLSTSSLGHRASKRTRRD